VKRSILRTMAPLEDGTPRAEVMFSPMLLAELTPLWIEFETTVPQAAEAAESQGAQGVCCPGCRPATGPLRRRELSDLGHGCLSTRSMRSMVEL
jgi:hypothetical protein